MRARYWFLLILLALFPSTQATEMRFVNDDAPTLTSAKSGHRTVTNPRRVYPPSCLTLPLPTVPSGPRLSGTFTLRAGATGFAPVTFTLWRVPCGTTKSVLLATASGSSAMLLQMPEFLGRQNGQAAIFRLAQEPNTLGAFTFDFQLSSGPRTFIFEVHDSSPSVPDVNQPMSMAAAYPSESQPVIPEFVMPAYDPAAYPNVAVDQELSGYLTGSYYDPSRSGEGMLLEVAEVGTTLLAVVSWYTFDDDGFPVWLVGAAPFTHGARSVTVNLASKFGGRLAGNFNPATVQDLPWGAVTLRFPTCGQLRFTYVSTHNTQGLPVGQGERLWSRLTSVNRFACE